ncbi:MAG: hypothetical protein E7374_02070 [Clostridiales bacterium]|nr:hypothetical protein [Clostridiales bacterium]
MCLFRYREKKYGKFTLILFALLVIALAGASAFGGAYAVMEMSHWSKWIILAVASVVCLALVVFGVVLICIATSMINTWHSVRDLNTTGKIKDVRLCDKCGRVISKKAQICEHCGTQQETGLGMKDCPECKTKNSGTAKFCEKCGYEFK